MSAIEYENSGDVDIVGTSLMGYIGTSYNELEAAFGNPTYYYAEGATTVEWVLQLKVPNGGDFDYVTATIYDRREDYKPLEDKDKEGVWHIGGFERASVDAVYMAMGR